MAEKEKTKPTGIAMTPEEEQAKFDKVLEIMIDAGKPLRVALRIAHYGAAKFYEFLEAKDLEKFRGTQNHFKGELIHFTDEYIAFTRELRQKQYARAREILVENFLYETIEIADDGSNDTYIKTLPDGTEIEETNYDVLGRSKMRIEARQWHITKVMPRKYGNKVEQTVVGDAEKPLTILSLGAGINPEAE